MHRDRGVAITTFKRTDLIAKASRPRESALLVQKDVSHPSQGGILKKLGVSQLNELLLLRCFGGGSHLRLVATLLAQEQP